MRTAVACALVAFALVSLFVPNVIAVESSGSSAQLKASPITCIKQKQAIECDLISDCVWCVKPNSKIGTGCYPMAAARLLPTKWGIECDKPLNGTVTAKTTANKDQQENLQGTCDAKTESTCIFPYCVWCTSAAVPASCYTPAEAKLLPKAVFKCKTAPSATNKAT